VTKRKIKIAYIGTKGIPAKWGGIEKYIEEVGKRMVTRGHEVTVFSSKWYCQNYENSLYQGMRIERVPSIQLQATDALTNALWSSLAIIKGNYDIAHFHGLASYYYIPIVKKAGKITITTTHEMESNWENTKYNFLGRLVIKQAFKLGVKHAHYTTTVAQHLKDKIKSIFGREALLLPSGLDRVEYQALDVIKRKYGLHGKDYLLFLGRIDPIKRVEWILDLASILDESIYLVIAGGAQDSSTEAYLKDLKQKAGPDSNIIFTGPVSGREKAELFSNCLLFLAPSMDEGLPLTVLEAISYGQCCIVSDLPAFRTVIENGVTGFLFPTNDKDQFMAMVANLIQTPQKLKLIGKEAKRKITPAFDWDQTVKQTEWLYNQLLDK
jgi:glycosyltransferase involved in cell wall biosynthesis